MLLHKESHLPHFGSHCKMTKIKTIAIKLNSYLNAKHFFIAFSHAHFHFWSHEPLTDRSITKQNSSVSRVFPFSWHMILLVTWKHSAWVFYHWALSLNGNVTAHRSLLSVEKMLAFYESSLTRRNHVQGLCNIFCSSRYPSFKRCPCRL